VSELDAATGSVVQTIGAPAGSPTGISSDGTHVWVASANGVVGTATVSELDAATGSVVQAITVGGRPYDISSDGTHVWWTNLLSSNVTELDAATGSVVQAITLGPNLNGISSDGTHVWVTQSGSVIELDAVTGSFIQGVQLGSGALFLSSDGTHVWVDAGSQVSEISIVGFTITTSSLPSATRGVAYGPVTLGAANVGISNPPYSTTLKWQRVAALPRGLKLSKDGVLSGIPNARLTAGPSSVTVQATESMTTLYYGYKRGGWGLVNKVKTKTAVQATIPLTIN